MIGAFEQELEKEEEKAEEVETVLRKRGEEGTRMNKEE